MEMTKDLKMATVKDVMIVVVKLTWKFAYFCDTTF